MIGESEGLLWVTTPLMTAVLPITRRQSMSMCRRRSLLRDCSCACPRSPFGVSRAVKANVRFSPLTVM